MKLKYSALQLGYWVDYLIISSFAAVFLMGRGFSASEIGWVTTVAAVLTIVLQISLSSLADHSKKISVRQILIALAIGCMAAAACMMLLPGVHAATFVGMFTAFSLSNAMSPLLTSLCLQLNDNGANINYGLARSCGSLGYALGGIVMGRVIERFGAETILPVYCVVYAVVLLLLIMLRGPQAARSARETAADDQPASSGLIEFFRRYRRYDLLLVSVVLMYFTQMVLATYMIYFVRSYGGNEADMGVVLFVSAFSEMPAVALGVTFLHKLRAQALLRIASVAAAIKFTVMVFITSPGAFIALQLIQFFFSGLYMVSSVYYANSIVGPGDAVKAQSILAVALSGVAGISANLIGGFMLERTTPQMLAVVGAVAAILGSVMMFITTRRRPFRSEQGRM